MLPEIETKFLNIDVTEIRRKLRRLGAALIEPERLMRRKHFDFPDKRLQKLNGFVRVRDEGQCVTMTYKQVSDRTLLGTHEINHTIDDFEKGCQFLEEIGMEQKSYHETKHESWKLGRVEIEIDWWPWLPPLVEIEAPDEPSLIDIVQMLELERHDHMHGTVDGLYARHYNVTEDEVNAWPEITFTSVSDWLQSKRRTEV